MRFGIGRIFKLLRHVGLFAVFLNEFSCAGYRAWHTLRPRCQHNLCTQHTQQHAALDGHRFWHRQNELITLGGTDEGQRNAGVAGSRLDDDAALPDLTIALGGFDHRLTDAILDTGEGVKEFAL